MTHQRSYLFKFGLEKILQNLYAQKINDNSLENRCLMIKL